MKMIIETFVTIIFLSIAVVLTTQVIGSQISINQANDFHVNAVQVIEESNFDSGVIEKCKEEAEALGYTLTVNVYQEARTQCAECNHIWGSETEGQCEICGSTYTFTNYLSSGGIVTLDYGVELAMLGISKVGYLEANAR